MAERDVTRVAVVAHGHVVIRLILSTAIRSCLP